MATNQQKYTYTLEAQYKGSSELGRLKSDIESISKVESFRDLSADVLELNRQFLASKQILEQQAAEMKEADTVTKEMTASYQKQQKEVARLADALDKKKRAYSESKKSLKEMGVDTQKLAAEEKRLATAAEATGKVWAARRALGVKSHRDITAEIGKLRLAYDTLRTSGTLTSKELYQAKLALNQRIRELRTTTVGWAGDLARVQTGLLGLGAAAYGVGKAFGAFSGFETGMAAVYTLVDYTKEQFAEFKDEIRDVSADLPQSTEDLTKALYDIISAGVEVGDSATVLEQAGKAATAGLTDTTTAANVGLGVINAYGKGVDELGSVYDVLFQTVKSGVTTFPALAQNLGEVLPTARAAGVELKDVGAAVAALTKAGIKTPQAMTALKGAINAMAAPAPEAKKKFDELGITWKGLIPTLEQIREKGLSIDQLRLLIPDTEARTGVISLTQNFDELQKVLDAMDGAAGEMEKAYQKMADTPAQKIADTSKELSEMGVQLGGLASVVILPTAEAIGSLVRAINEAPAPIRATAAAIGAAVTGAALWGLGLGSVVKGIYGLVTALRAAVVAIAGLKAAGLVSWLATTNVATITTTGSTIALTAALKAAAAASVVFWSANKVIEAYEAYKEMREAQKMAAEAANRAEEAEARYQARLKRASEAAGIPIKSYKDVQKAYQDGLLDYDRSTDTYSKGSGIRRQSFETVAQAARDSAAVQKEVTAEALEEMKRKYQEYATQIQQIQSQILDRERSLAEQLRGMGRTGMAALEAWNDLKREAQEYEAAAKRAADAGDFEDAVKLADKAKEKYAQLNTEVKSGDKVLVSQSTALETAMKGVESAGTLAIEALKRQKEAAQQAAKELDSLTTVDLAKEVGLVKEEVEGVTDATEIMGGTMVDMINEFGAEAAEEFDKIEQWLRSPHQMKIDIVTTGQPMAAGGAVQALAAGGAVGLRDMLRGGHFPGFGGGDRRHVVAEDGEYMLDKFTVRDAGLRAVRAFHARRWDLVVNELVHRFNLPLADLVHRKLGGAISAINNLPAPPRFGPQMMAAGGAVVGAGEMITHEIVVRNAAGGPPARLYGDALSAEMLERVLRRAWEGSS